MKKPHIQAGQSNQSKDPFAEVPEFLTAFDNIAQNGFFEEVSMKVGGAMDEGIVRTCCVTAWGCVPNSPKYATAGCGTIIDPHSIVAACRKLAEQKKIEKIVSEIKGEDWILYSADENTIKGSKGRRTRLYLLIIFKT